MPTKFPEAFPTFTTMRTDDNAALKEDRVALNEMLVDGHFIRSAFWAIHVGSIITCSHRIQP